MCTVRPALPSGRPSSLRRLEAGDDRVGVAEEQGTGIRDAHAARPAGALDELLADEALELGDLLADGRLGVAELARRAAEGQVPRDRLERRQMAELDPGPSITFHNQNES